MSRKSLIVGRCIDAVRLGEDALQRLFDESGLFYAALGRLLP